MAGNPNHDSKGRFASASGLNKANSTITQRGKARVKEHISAGKAFAVGAVGVAAAGIGAAVLQGVTKPVRAHSMIIANKAINAGISKTESLVAAHGPTIAKAIQSKGSTLLNHVKNMKIAGKAQHNVSSVSSKSSSYKSPSQLKSELSTLRAPSAGKPVVRVPMRRK
jgi:hypothetical protein